MGFFSWKTQDTDKSIANQFSTRSTFTVAMLDDRGNKWYESNYEGYGLFGGKDYYELLAEMNGCTSELTGEAYTDEMRSKGINLAFENSPHGNNPNIKHPNLVEECAYWHYTNEAPESCNDQGFFYCDEDEEEEYQYEEQED